MKTFFLLIFFNLVPAHGFSQTRTEIARVIDQLPVSANSIYLFCRGTTTKSGFIARDFNLKDTNITHVGLGHAENGSFRIYNVTDTRGFDNALLIDSVASFIAEEDVYYFSIWECKSTKRDIGALNKILKRFLERKIIFDISFQLNKDDTLYCSEFCATLLNETNPRQYHFEPVKRKLNDRLFTAILKREELIYYPVDFFRTNKNFRKLCEFRLQSDRKN